MTGAPYVASRFAELPAYAANVVRGTRLSPEQWDALVAAGGASAVPGIGGWHALAGWRAEVNSRDYDNPPADVCGDCFGTCVTADIDGSITGTVGEPFLCFCAQGALAQVGR
ncbi:HAD family acid phosphatase [Gandjariella thermophila]|nr:HAD family acid phosphatase [Gandjariella thermophila]